MASKAAVSFAMWMLSPQPKKNNTFIKNSNLCLFFEFVLDIKISKRGILIYSVNIM